LLPLRLLQEGESGHGDEHELGRLTVEIALKLR
jgi:hypothetical protein